MLTNYLEQILNVEPNSIIRIGEFPSFKFVEKSKKNIHIHILIYFCIGNVLTLQLPTISGLPETLPAPHLSVSQLDAHSFLYAATYTAG